MNNATWSIRAEDLETGDHVSLSTRTRKRVAIDYEVLDINGQVYTLAPLDDPHQTMVRRRTTLDRASGLFLLAPRITEEASSDLHAQALLDGHPVLRAMRYQYRLIFDSLHTKAQDRIRFQTWTCLTDLSRAFAHPNRHTRRVCVETLIQQVGDQDQHDLTVGRRFAEATTHLLTQALLRA